MSTKNKKPPVQDAPIDFSAVEDALLSAFDGSPDEPKPTNDVSFTKVEAPPKKKSVKAAAKKESTPAEATPTKTPLHLYTPLLVAVTPHGVIKECHGVVYTPDEAALVAKVKDRKVIGVPCGYIADLNSLDEEILFQNEWKIAPNLPRLIDQLLDGTHPRCEGKFHPSVLVPAFKALAEPKSKNGKPSVSTVRGNGYRRLSLISRADSSVGKETILEINSRIAKLNLVNPFEDITTLPLPDPSTVKGLGIETPLGLTQKEMEDLLDKAQQVNDYNGWIHDPATMLEFEDNREMIKEITKHCEAVPNFKITYLRKRLVAYTSDGSMANTLDAINRPQDKRSILVQNIKGRYQIVRKEGVTSEGAPLIFFGEAWVIEFTVGGKDPMQGGRVVFATPDQFVAAYKDTRPDLIEDFKPWADYIFVASTFCERNGSRVKLSGGGIDLSSPHQRRLSLAHWILGPLASKAAREGTPFNGIVTQNGYDVRDRLATLKSALNSKSKDEQELEKFVTGLVPTLKAEPEKPKKAAPKASVKKKPASSTKSSPTKKKV